MPASRNGNRPEIVTVGDNVHLTSRQLGLFGSSQDLAFPSLGRGNSYAMGWAGCSYTPANPRAWAEKHDGNVRCILHPRFQWLQLRLEILGAGSGGVVWCTDSWFSSDRCRGSCVSLIWDLASVMH